MSQLDIEKNPQNLLKRLEEIQRRLDELERRALTKNPLDDLAYGAFFVGARVYNSSNILIPDATLTDLTFDSERKDTNEIHSTSSNTERLTCQTEGFYIITGSVEFASTAVGNRRLYIRLNGSTYIAANINNAVSQASLVHRQTIAAIYFLEVGDYLTLSAYQNSGGSLNVVSSGNHSPEFAMVRIP